MPGRLCFFFLIGALVGCASDDPTGPEIASGGAERQLDFEAFVTDVEPVLRARGCSADGACHGGGIRGAFALSPDHDPDPAFDFAQVADQVDDLEPAASPLLRKPLAEDAGGAPHSFTAFTSTDDADYRAVLAWIEAGELRP